MMAQVQSALLERGAYHFKGAAKPLLADLEGALASIPPDEAGVRLRASDHLSGILSIQGGIGKIVASALGSHGRPVRAILFNKSPSANWALGWHQDRTICVRERCEIEGYGPWTLKQGLHHVEPPFHILADMVTARVHLDDVPASNAPLLVALGSHRLGRVPVDETERAVRHCTTLACLAQAGDVWLYSTPIIHASSAAVQPNSRRVLQIDYSAHPLPAGLEWIGI